MLVYKLVLVSIFTIIQKSMPVSASVFSFIAISEPISIFFICPLAPSYIARNSTPGAAAELAASPKTDKYANLPNSYLFKPIALENVGAIEESDISLTSDLGRKSA